MAAARRFTHLHASSVQQVQKSSSVQQVPEFGKGRYKDGGMIVKLHSVFDVPEFGKGRYKDGGMIVKLHSVFDGAFSNVKITTISKQVVDMHQRKIKLWEAWST
jgi:hypothetical protein